MATGRELNMPEREMIDLHKINEKKEPAAPQFSQETLNMLLQLQLGDLAEKAKEKAQLAERKENSKQEMRKMVSKYNADRAQAQENCGMNGHRSEDGRFSLIRGQVHNDGLYHPLCIRCMKEFPPRKPQGEQINRSAN